MPDFRRRLGRTQQVIYDRSNSISSIPLKASPRLLELVAALPATLQTGDPRLVQSTAQAITDQICASLRVPVARVFVEGTRPSNPRGELHGLYTPHTRGTPCIKVWMITAKRGQVVAFKTFLRTLLHEICHHLDYTLLRLGDSLHTDGFYKRESSLFHQIGASTVSPRRTAPPNVRALAQK